MTPSFVSAVREGHAASTLASKGLDLARHGNLGYKGPGWTGAPADGGRPPTDVELRNADKRLQKIFKYLDPLMPWVSARSAAFRHSVRGCHL